MIVSLEYCLTMEKDINIQKNVKRNYKQNVVNKNKKSNKFYYFLKSSEIIKIKLNNMNRFFSTYLYFIP